MFLTTPRMAKGRIPIEYAVLGIAIAAWAALDLPTGCSRRRTASSVSSLVLESAAWTMHSPSKQSMPKDPTSGFQ
jgi:hypothetical protein